MNSNFRSQIRGCEPSVKWPFVPGLVVTIMKREQGVKVKRDEATILPSGHGAFSPQNSFESSQFINTMPFHFAF